MYECACGCVGVTQELSPPPLVDDFLYLCDDAYTHDDLLSMERDILKKLNYDINIPVAYQFLRRLARVGGKWAGLGDMLLYLFLSPRKGKIVVSIVHGRPLCVCVCVCYTRYCMLCTRKYNCHIFIVFAMQLNIF